MPSNKKQLDRTPQQQQMIDCIPVLRHPQEPWPGYWKEIADAVVAERDGLAAKLAEAREVLRSLEWSVHGTNDDHCPSCGRGERNGHWEKCKLAAVLREGE